MKTIIIIAIEQSIVKVILITIFNKTAMPTPLLPRALAAVSLAAGSLAPPLVSGLGALLALSQEAVATAYWELPALLTSFFPEAERVSYAKVVLSPAERARITARTGREVRADWTIFVALQGGKPAGYAVVDEVRGLHEPITFATRFDTLGAISRMEVMAYREAYGGEVREQRFLRQFNGRSAAKPFRAGREIAAISGATISSYAVTQGAESAAAVIGLLLAERPQALTPNRR